MKLILEYNLSAETLRSLCIIKKWFTCGTIQQYEEMFSVLNSEDDHTTPEEILNKISEMIYEYSSVESTAKGSLIESGDVQQFIDTIDEEVRDSIIQGIKYDIISFTVNNNKFPSIL